MKLVTFGCSWTRGIGTFYHEGMTREEYRIITDTKDPESFALQDVYSFRILLAERLGAENINFSQGGSSNQKQERHAIEYFNQNSPEDTVVLWGITSLVRNEHPINGKLQNYMYSTRQHDKWPQETIDAIAYHYDHFFDEKLELVRINNMMIHWNKFFEAHKIPNLWFQTFNSYRFPEPVERLAPRDLLTNLTHPAVRDDHMSDWKLDSHRIRKAVRDKLVNPYSLHPTVETHVKIADMLEPHLRSVL
tara:strand:+ start:736 stop:1479 length:744 start_codon:yes stop_codon:yes gene_type:complete